MPEVPRALSQVSPRVAGCSLDVILALPSLGYTPNWERVSTSGGYFVVHCPDHPRAWSTGYVYAHIVLAEMSEGRLLLPDEVVHHKDENKFNNDPRNFEVVSRPAHTKDHKTRGVRVVRFRCPACGTNFERERRKTHLVKPTKLRATCCSDRCRGRLSRSIQIGGATARATLQSIATHVLYEYTRHGE